MKQEYIVHYETLGLNPDASPEEVKKAYFRLVRKYPPEKAPEQFQKIRQAYEALKDGPPAESEDFTLPEDPEALSCLKEGERRYRQEDYEYAAKQFLKALNAAPDNPYILWRLSSTLMDNDNPQKAAKYLEQLARQYPDNREVFAALAQAYQYRGWHKKALPYFQRSYDLGNRDSSFLLAFADARHDNHDNAAAAMFWEAIQHYQPDCGVSVSRMLLAFCGYAKTAEFFKPAALEYLDVYASFMKKNKRRMDDLELALAPLFTFISEHPRLIFDRDVLKKISSLLDRMKEYGGEWPSYTHALYLTLLDTALKNDPRNLHEDWRLFTLELPKEHAEDRQLNRYKNLDIMLCVIEDWERLKKEYPVIQADYPALLQGFKEFFSQLEAGEADALFDQLKWEFDKVSDKFNGSEYLKRHPEEKNKTLYVSKDTDAAPYVRSGEKVGRNDPCPCGSGRKFKKCCMGKGIYD